MDEVIRKAKKRKFHYTFYFTLGINYAVDQLIRNLLMNLIKGEERFTYISGRVDTLTILQSLKQADRDIGMLIRKCKCRQEQFQFSDNEMLRNFRTNHRSDHQAVQTRSIPVLQHDHIRDRFCQSHLQYGF